MTIDPQTGEGRQIINALESAQAALNPLSGLLRAPRPNVESYLDSVRDKVRSTKFGGRSDCYRVLQFSQLPGKAPPQKSGKGGGGASNCARFRTRGDGSESCS